MLGVPGIYQDCSCILSIPYRSPNLGVLKSVYSGLLLGNVENNSILVVPLTDVGLLYSPVNLQID